MKDPEQLSPYESFEHAEQHQDILEPPGLPLQDIVRMLEEQGQIGFWWHDVKRTDKISVSPGLARISGVPVSVPRTRDSMFILVHPQDRAAQEDVITLLESGQPSRREFRIVRPDGAIRWLSARFDVVLDEDGHPELYFGTLADITERREAQRSLEFTQGRRAALLKATSALTWTADLAGQPIDYTAWCTLTGMTPRNCREGGWLDAVHPNDRDRVRAAYQEAVAETTVCDIDYRILMQDGEYRWYRARMAPVRDASGIVGEWQGVLIASGNRRQAASDAFTDAEAGQLTGAEIRAARGFLDWSLTQLASASGVSVSTIKRMEDGSEGITRASKSEAVRRALQNGGVKFRTADGTNWISR